MDFNMTLRRSCMDKNQGIGQIIILFETWENIGDMETLFDLQRI